MSDETRIAEVLGEWFERQGSGDPLDPEELIRRHPDLAAELRIAFGLLDAAAAHGAGRAADVPEVLGSYRIEDELGAGGMGRVFRASCGDGSTVALKLVHPHLFRTPGFFKRFLREAELGRKVRHPNVVRTLDVDAVEIDGRHHHFLVMEHVEGRTLRALLDDLERVPEELCRHIAAEVCAALAAIHAVGAVHRDLKPENVLITPEHCVKVMDLGVAQLLDEAMRLSQTGAFVGSVRYAAPEQFRGGGRELDARTDLHALGVLLYELAAGRHPFAADDARVVMRRILDEEPRRLGELNPQLTPFFEELVQRLLAKSPDDRFPSAEAVARVLDDGERSEWWRDRAREIRAIIRRPLRRIHVPRETAVHGRDEQLARMRGLYERAKSGHGQVVLLQGEAGIGKTRVVDELVARLRQGGEEFHFLFGSYPPAGASAAQGGLSTAFREQFGDAGSAPYLTERPRLVPGFDAVLRGEPPPPGALALTNDSLATAFVEATRALAAERPTIVLVDDLHFAPEEARGLFLSLALAAPGHRVLLVGTARPGLPGDWLVNVTRCDHVTALDLPRLGGKDLALLLIDAFHSERLAEELALKLLLKSDGNPFFVFEIIRGLREGQFLAQGPDGSWHTTRVIEEIQIPSSVLDLVNARVADLAEGERNLLDLAACWGFEFDPTLVADALGVARVAALQTLAHVEKRHRLVRSAGRRFVFDHHQVQEALDQSLPELLRDEYHAALAAALEARTKATDADPATLDGAVCVDLCEHFLKGAQGKRAMRYLDAALTHLEKQHGHGQAVDLADRALAVPGLVASRARVELLLRKVKRLDLLGRRNAERAALDEAQALADADGDAALRARVRASLGAHLWTSSRYDEAMGVLPEAQELARAANDRRTEGDATGKMGMVLSSLGRLAEARGYHEGHLALARSIGDRVGECVATINLGAVCVDRGSVAEAWEHFSRSLALAREIGDRRCESFATANLGVAAEALGRFPEAREHHERAVALARETGDRRHEASGTGKMGAVLVGLGHFTAGLEHLERHLALARETGDRNGEAIATGSLGVSSQCLGRFAEAREYVERHLALAQEIGNSFSEAHALANLGLLWHVLGRPLDARKHLERSIVLARELGARRVGGWAVQVLGELAVEQGDAAAAERRFAEALDLRHAIGSRDGEAETLLARGALLARLSRTDEARVSLREALVIARELSLPGVELLAAAGLATLPGGDADAVLALLRTHEDRAPHIMRMEARFLLWRATRDPAHLAEAKRRLDFLVEHAPPECRESMLANVRLHREIVEAWAARSR